MLDVFSQFSLDMTNKHIRFLFVFPQKDVKFVLSHRDKSVAFHAILILLPSIKDTVF